jgi:hypothetical protein
MFQYGEAKKNSKLISVLQQIINNNTVLPDGIYMLSDGI